MALEDYVPVFMLPFYGLMAFCARPRLWPYLLVPTLLFLACLAIILSALFTVGVVAQAFLGPLEIPALCGEVAVACLAGLIMFFQQVQRSIAKAALEDRGVYDKLCAEYGIQKLGEIGCCRNIHHNIYVALGRSIVLAVTTLATPAYLILVLGQLIMVSLLLILFALYTWNLVSESLGRMSICSCTDQAAFVLSHS